MKHLHVCSFSSSESALQLDLTKGAAVVGAMAWRIIPSPHPSISQDMVFSSVSDRPSLSLCVSGACRG